MCVSFQDAIDDFPIISLLEGITEVKDNGTDNVVINCPVCGKSKLSVHRFKKVAHCWRCAEGGHGGSSWNGKVNLVGLICLLEGCSASAAYKTISKLAGLPDYYAPRLTQHPPPEIFPDNCYPLSKVRNNHPAVKYLERRGVGHLRSVAKINMTEKEYIGRILLPCYWMNELVGVEAKSYCGQLPKTYYDPWFKTRTTLYTSRNFLPGRGYVVITESVLDSETVRRNAIGCYGSNLSDGHLLRLLELRKLGITKLIFLWDSDAFWKECKMLLSKTLPFFDNYVARLQGADDPNSIGYDRCRQAIENAVFIEDEFDIMDLTGDINEFRHSTRSWRYSRPVSAGS